MIGAIIFVISLAGCQSNGSPGIVVQPEDGLPTEEAVELQATKTAEPGLSYDSSTYTDEMAWIAMDYPQDWSIQQSTQVGERGWQGGLFSPGSSIESLAGGGSRVMITLYSWDPAGDIEAYTAQRKLAWEASGFKILDEVTNFLPDDRAVVTFLVVTSEGEKVVFAFLTTGDDYLEVSGQGDLPLCQEIIGTLRPID